MYCIFFPTALSHYLSLSQLPARSPLTYFACSLWEESKYFLLINHLTHSSIFQWCKSHWFHFCLPSPSSFSCVQDYIFPQSLLKLKQLSSYLSSVLLFFMAATPPFVKAAQSRGSEWLISVCLVFFPFHCWRFLPSCTHFVFQMTPQHLRSSSCTCQDSAQALLQDWTVQCKTLSKTAPLRQGAPQTLKTIRGTSGNFWQDQQVCALKRDFEEFTEEAKKSTIRLFSLHRNVRLTSVICSRVKYKVIIIAPFFFHAQYCKQRGKNCTEYRYYFCGIAYCKEIHRILYYHINHV